MFKTLSASVLIAAMATASVAQSVTQSSVVGTSTDATYSVQIVGSNGVTYNCLPDLQQRADGSTVRVCRRAGSDAGAMGGPGAAAAAIGIVLVGAAIAGGSSSGTD